MSIVGKILVTGLFFVCLAAFAQIDPARRDLIQFGYNQPLEGQSPLAGYAFYYHNQPNFIRTNLTWRLALAPVYADTELGWVDGLGPHRDFALGVAGGGFADGHNEVRGGRFIKGESFDGHGGEISASVYQLCNPGRLIPLNFVLRGVAHYSHFERNDNTDPAFQVPNSGMNFTLRTGFRYGGIEPTLYPALALELAAWYQADFRTDAGSYGFGGDRQREENSHLVWASAALAYTLPDNGQQFFVRLLAGSSLQPDRFSAYRLGGFLPLIAEYPLSLPGFFYQEISARHFALANASYVLPVTHDRAWNLAFNAASAVVNYLPGTGSGDGWVNGVGAGVMYHSPTDRFKVILNYAYGFDAIRSGGRGANSVGVLLQVDLEKAVPGNFSATHLANWRGWTRLFNR